MISPALSCRTAGVEIARILEVKGFVGTATSTKERIGHDIPRKQATENLACTFQGARKSKGLGHTRSGFCHLPRRKTS